MITLVAKNSVTRRYLKRGELMAKRRAESCSLEKVDTISERVEQALRAPNWREPKEESGGACLPQVAIFSAGHRKSENITAR
ncbi:hypothetical protein D8682_01290 [Buttiauxella sp. 3AFRM03]|uniref:transcriptional antitermination N peptide n=1 Tax=Buttiauxella sp. 3AFRM03 TaxID=2479367 RepID=UPI000EF7A797|nr:hypothetical protein [Buttiauxella sp. 3AFRM03]AYN25736.1 hypothetical protein D8682_01290 [Buttiauxella sp. 3AFRM03]